MVQAMSQFQTPNVPVNPNIPAANLQVPQITYGYQPYQRPNLVQYEQLTNVLQAGLEATQAFINYSIIDRDLEQNMISQTAKKLSGQFKRDVAEAKAKDAQETVGEQAVNRNLKATLERYRPMMTGMPEDVQTDYFGEVSKFHDTSTTDINKMNATMFSSLYRTTLSQIQGAAAGGDPESIQLLAEMDSPQKAWNVFVSRLDPQQRQWLATLTEYDRDLYIDQASTITASWLESSAQFKARLDKAQDDIDMGVKGNQASLLEAPGCSGADLADLRDADMAPKMLTE